MKNLLLILLISNLLLLSCTNSGEIDFKTKSFQVSINKKGELTKLINLNTGINHISMDSIYPLLTAKIDNEIVPPLSAELKDDILILKYNEDVEAQLKVKNRESYITFEIIKLTNNEIVDLVIWGPYPTSINEVIGETVGVVQGKEFAIGIQALNPKTLGGYPWKDNDCLPQIDIFEQDDLSDLTEEGKRYVLYRVEAAKPTKFGSTLQAYCRNRSKDRTIENWQHKNYIAPAYEDGGVIGSKIALFGCSRNKILKIIEEIEIAEGLPHPEIDGKWGKTASEATSAYMIINFGEDNIEKAIDITKKAGLSYLYHPGPFKNWGHFELKEEQFPKGMDGMKNCVELAEKNGIKMGLHTLSNFITTNDPYVTPLPDKRLAVVGSSELTEEINKSQTEIPIKSPDFFNQYKNNHLKTVRVGNELIRYGKVSESTPWKLLDCQRGAYQTTISKHDKESQISKLADHGYKVFLTNNELSKEMAEVIADIYNKTGLRQISFDGIEGNRSTGMGNYAETLFAKAWYDKINDNIKDHFIADASRTTHYFWHIYTRMNWGEPWYAGFRESQTTDRLRNQKYFKRNLMPSMLGWFLMKPETSIEDIEWLLARSAAFDAGYAFVTKYETIDKNGNSDKIMELIGEWEKVRMAGLFTNDQKKRMEDIKNEFSLKKINNNEWNLVQINSGKFKHEKKTRQPGEPLYSTFKFKNDGEDQIVNFILSAIDSDVSGIKIEIDNYKEIILPVKLKAGEHIKYFGGEKAYVYNEFWQQLSEFEFDSSAMKANKGEHSLTFDCKFTNADKNAMIKLEIRTSGYNEKLSI